VRALSIRGRSWKPGSDGRLGVSEWRVGRRHYGYRVYEGTRPVANFREKEDAALAVRLHNDHVRAEARDRELTDRDGRVDA
jgi:hypothetical protein